MSNSNASSDFFSTEELRCPNCGTMIPVYWHEYLLHSGEGERTVVCQECDKPFKINVIVSISFKSPPLHQEKEGD